MKLIRSFHKTKNQEPRVNKKTGKIDSRQIELFNSILLLFNFYFRFLD